MNAGPEKAFRGINVAHTHDNIASQQGLLDRGFLPSQGRVQHRGVKCRVKRLYTQSCKEGVAVDISIFTVVPKHGAKAPWVVQAQGGVIEHPLDVVMPSEQLAWQNAADGARHAQVNDERALLKVDQQVFASAPTGLHRLPLNNGWQDFRNRPAHASFVNQHGFQALTCCNRVKSPTGCFNFGQFWHG